ncbi:MAG: hypothetical protein LQ342_001411 [Letrouitia transgressa]|nr:MAG: hypothetical protein LQ342_001411 [Letrouitia transgressa]
MRVLNSNLSIAFIILLPLLCISSLGFPRSSTKNGAVIRGSNSHSQPSVPSLLASRVLKVFTKRHQPRSPVETPPTEYLPYPPPPNYQWPPGPHTQYPPPSETNAPAWYGGTGTGGQGNSGAGSASHKSASAPLLLSSSFLPRILARLIPRAFRQQSHQIQVRDPVETPPTQFLPYAPPPDYQWPAGYTPGNENPQPSENNPQVGSSGQGSPGQGQAGSAGNPGANAGSGGSSSNAQSASSGAGSGGSGGGGNLGLAKTIGIIMGCCVAAVVVLAILWKFVWGRKRDGNGDGCGKAGRFNWKGLFPRIKLWKTRSKKEATEGSAE